MYASNFHLIRLIFLSVCSFPLHWIPVPFRSKYVSTWKVTDNWRIASSRNWVFTNIFQISLLLLLCCCMLYVVPRAGKYYLLLQLTWHFVSVWKLFRAQVFAIVRAKFSTVFRHGGKKKCSTVTGTGHRQDVQQVCAKENFQLCA